MTLEKTKLHVHAVAARRCYWLSVFCLFFSLMGGVLFVVGSYLYRPEFDTHCGRFKRRNPDSLNSEWCLSTVTSGTWLYIVGSCFYVAQAGVNLWKCCAKHRAERSSMLQFLGVDSGSMRLPG